MTDDTFMTGDLGDPLVDEPVATRRTALKRLAVAGAGVAAGVAAVANRSAEAANGSAVTAGQITTATSPTIVHYTGAPLPTNGASAFSAAEAPPGPGATDGVDLFPAALGGYGVLGVVNGVHGSTRQARGYGVVAANAAAPTVAQEAPVALALAALGAHVRFLPPRTLNGSGAADQVGPSVGIHSPGELLVDDEFSLWFSVPVGDGALGWVKLAGRDTAGQFHPLPVPLRIYDSRTGQGPASTGDGPLAPGQERTIDLTLGYQGTSTVPVDAVPAAATAAALNITVVDTEGAGFLAVFSADQAYSGTSNLNWSGPGQIVANYAVSATSLAGAVKVRAGGTGPTNLIVDVSGFYR